MIPVQHDGDDGWVKEHCCFCFARTNYWFIPKDVAVCQECAKTRLPTEVPSKVDWCKAVRAKFPNLGQPWRVA